MATTDRSLQQLLEAHPEYYDNPARAAWGLPSLRVLFFWLLHIPLGILNGQNEIVATIHAWGTLAIAFYFILRNHRPIYIVYLIGYIAAAEPLWRTNAIAFYEFAKYAISVCLILATIRQNRLRQIDFRPILYFCLLLPSLTVLPEFDREAISFNLSGPLVLALSLMYFGTVTIRQEELIFFVYIVLAPIVGIYANALFFTVRVENIVFVQASNSIAAGNSGPNQISAILGLGALLAFLALITFNQRKLLKVFLLIFLVGMISQSALTFSRGGLYAAVGAILLATLILLRDQRLRITILLGELIGGLLISLIVLPLLNNFTGGQLLLRLQDPDTTGRDTAILSDWQQFVENPLLGVGPGQSEIGRVRELRPTRAHTEYTRVLAEHGMFGGVALLVLFWVLVPHLFHARSSTAYAYKTILLAWVLVTMAHIATRMALPGVIAGIGIATLQLIPEKEEDNISDLTLSERLEVMSQ